MIDINSPSVVAAIDQYATDLHNKEIEYQRKTNPERLATVTPEQLKRHWERMREQGEKSLRRFATREGAWDAVRVGVLHPSNESTRRLFTAVTGVALPSSVAGTRSVLRKWIGEELIRGWEEDAARQESEERETARALKENAEQERMGQFQGFASDQPKMRRERAYATLETQIRANGVIVTRKELVQDRLGKGWKVVVRNGARLFACEETGAYFTESDLTKTALDYAEHLIQTYKGEAA